MTTKYPEMQHFVFFSFFDHVIHIEGTEVTSPNLHCHSFGRTEIFSQSIKS